MEQHCHSYPRTPFCHFVAFAPVGSVSLDSQSPLAPYESSSLATSRGNEKFRNAFLLFARPGWSCPTGLRIGPIFILNVSHFVGGTFGREISRLRFTGSIILYGTYRHSATARNDRGSVEPYQAPLGPWIFYENPAILRRLTAPPPSRGRGLMLFVMQHWQHYRE